MIYYPVCIPTLNRYEHLKACVESLQRCTHADKTELIIGLDALPPPPNYEVYRVGYEKVKAYLPTITGFAKVTILERDTNYGAERNWDDLAKYCLKHYDAYIFVQDDTEVSPCFLDYMDKVLERYRDDSRILSVSGYLHSACYGPNPNGLFLSLPHSDWGTGYWKDKWENTVRPYMHGNNDFFLKMIRSKKISDKVIAAYPAGYWILFWILKSKRSHWGDHKISLYNVATDHYQLRPAVSMVRNIGCDGSGENSPADASYILQQIRTDAVFDLSSEPEEMRPEILYHREMPTDPAEFKKVLKTIKIKTWLIRIFPFWFRLETLVHRYWLGILRRCGRPV